MGIGSTRCLTDGGLTHLPDIKDGDIKVAFKELMAVNWAELPDSVVNKANRALSKNTEDKASQEALANLLRAAEAVDEFTGFLVTLKMEIDDSVGLSGEVTLISWKLYISICLFFFMKFCLIGKIYVAGCETFIR